MVNIGSPFHARTSALCATPWWYGWNSYLIPDVYTSMPSELAAVRSAVGMIDMSPLPKFSVFGPDAPRLIDRLITRDVGKLASRQIYYTPLCSEDGKMVNDGLVFRLDETTFFLSMDNCDQWLSLHTAGLKVEIRDITAEYGLLSLQGPRSREVLEAATGESWSALPFSRLETATIGGAEVFLARQGYTGELGYELWVKADEALALFDAIMVAGEAFDVQMVGEYAVEVARVEAGLILVSADYVSVGPDQRCADVEVDETNTATPFELGLGHLVDFGKGSFLGREALLAEKERGPDRRLIGLEVDWTAIARHAIERGQAPNVSPRVRWDALAVQAGETHIGRATSLTWSPTLGKMIGFGCLKMGYAEPGTSVTIRWPLAGELVAVPAITTELPFLAIRRSG